MRLRLFILMFFPLTVIASDCPEGAKTCVELDRTRGIYLHSQKQELSEQEIYEIMRSFDRAQGGDMEDQRHMFEKMKMDYGDREGD